MSIESQSPQTSPPPAKPRRLGRGLASLMANTRSHAVGAYDTPVAIESPAPVDAGQYIPANDASDSPQASSEPLADIPVGQIDPNPHQPRRQFKESDLAELAASIRRQGVLQPLLVTPKGDHGGSGYFLVAGERRLRAARLAGLLTVPCVIRQADRGKMIEWALVENIQRADLNPIDRASAYRDYMDRFGASQQDLAERMGEPRSTVANYLRMLDLCDTVQSLVVEGLITFGHAKLLASLAGKEALQTQFAKQVVTAGLSVRQLEQYVATALGKQPAEPASPTIKPTRGKTEHILDLERQLARVVGTRVLIQPGRARNRGRITIEYYSLNDFDRIVESLGAELEQ